MTITEILRAGYGLLLDQSHTKGKPHVIRADASIARRLELGPRADLFDVPLADCWRQP